MALSEADRRELLADLGLSPDGESLTIAPQPEAASAEPEPAPPTQRPDVEALTDEQLLAPGAFDRHKLAKSEVGKLVSSPHNIRLYARIQEAVTNQRNAERAHRLAAKHERKKEERTHVRQKVRAATATKAAEAVLEAMSASGIDLDELAALLKERNA